MEKRIVTSHLAVLICFFIDNDVDTTFNLAPLNDCLSIDIKERRRKKEKKRYFMKMSLLYLHFNWVMPYEIHRLRNSASVESQRSA